MARIRVSRRRALSGLRLVLTTGARSLGGSGGDPARQAPALRARAAGAWAERALAAWTGQTSAPVAVWNDERPRTTSLEILFLAERLARAGADPDDPDERARMFGYCHEDHRRAGPRLGAALDLAAPDPRATGDSAPHGTRGARRHGGEAAAATDRIVTILRMLAAQLERQRKERRRFWSVTGYRRSTSTGRRSPRCSRRYQALPDPGGGSHTADGPMRDALDPALLAHRDFVYRAYLPPVDCNDS
jgi:hypothetical protein